MARVISRVTTSHNFGLKFEASSGAEHICGLQLNLHRIYATHTARAPPYDLLRCSAV